METVEIYYIACVNQDFSKSNSIVAKGSEVARDLSIERLKRNVSEEVCGSFYQYRSKSGLCFNIPQKHLYFQKVTKTIVKENVNN